MDEPPAIPQYADVPWPWGEFPRLPRTRWSPSPWRVALFDADHAYEYNILMALGAYLTMHVAMLQLSKVVGYPLSIRPTIVCGTMHAFGTAIAASVLLFVGGREVVWQRIALPCSVSYFLADILWYCLPRRDLTMTLHHLVMIGCHYPIGEMNGALVAGAGNPGWCVRLSMIGYLSEWTTAFLNVRWLLAHISRRYKRLFTVVSSLLLFTYAYRLVLFPYLLAFEIFPKYSLYAEKEQILTFTIMVLGHLIVLQLSIQWVFVILRYGVSNFLVLKSTTSAGGQKAPAATDDKKQGNSSATKNGAGFDWRRSIVEEGNQQHVKSN